MNTLIYIFCIMCAGTIIFGFINQLDKANKTIVHLQEEIKDIKAKFPRIEGEDINGLKTYANPFTGEVEVKVVEGVTFFGNIDGLSFEPNGGNPSKPIKK